MGIRTVRMDKSVRQTTYPKVEVRVTLSLQRWQIKSFRAAPILRNARLIGAFVVFMRPRFYRKKAPSGNNNAAILDC